MKIASFKAGNTVSYGIVTGSGVIDGDVVEVEISGIGVLRNPVKDEALAA